MSFGNRMRAQRSGAFSLIAALAASIGMAGIAAPPAPVNLVTGQQQETPREFLDERTRKTRPTKKKRRVHRRLPFGLSGPVVWDSPHNRRRLLMALAERPNTGRQWVRVRRAIRSSPIAFLLTEPIGKLATRVKIARRIGAIA